MVPNAHSLLPSSTGPPSKVTREGQGRSKSNFSLTYSAQKHSVLAERGNLKRRKEKEKTPHTIIDQEIPSLWGDAGESNGTVHQGRDWYRRIDLPTLRYRLAPSHPFDFAKILQS
jgi:hypothetical protein